MYEDKENLTYSFPSRISETQFNRQTHKPPDKEKELRTMGKEILWKIEGSQRTVEFI